MVTLGIYLRSVPTLFDGVRLGFMNKGEHLNKGDHLNKYCLPVEHHYHVMHWPATGQSVMGRPHTSRCYSFIGSDYKCCKCTHKKGGWRDTEYCIFGKF